jgi:hypothetical protein
MFYGDCMKMCEDFYQNLAENELSVESRQRTVSQHDCRPPPTPLALLALLWLFSVEGKLKSRHFNTTGVIETELQTVLNTLTEIEFQDAFYNLQKLWEYCIRAEGYNLNCDGGQ